MSKHLYLFTLEVEPLKVGDIYDELPLHCTLMFRFWSELPAEELTEKVQALFDQTKPILLIVKDRQLLGPKQVAAGTLELTDSLKRLHAQLHTLLVESGVEFTAPQWVDTGYKPHITDREHAQFSVDQKHLSRTAYLIEIGTNEHAHKRIVRVKFELKG